MDAKELRIGNWVLIKGKPTQVESIDDQGINSSVSGGYYPGETEIKYEAYFQGQSLWRSYPEPEGIPLTAEILEACGFNRPEEPRSVLSIQVGNQLYLHYDVFDLFFTVVPETWRGTDLLIWNDVKHLHQLQNLFFALGGSELRVNLTQKV